MADDRKPDDAWSLAEIEAALPLRRRGALLALAAHAALPVALTARFLHLLWANFLLDGRGAADSAREDYDAFQAASDLLFSPLCREIGSDLYEMQPGARARLLVWLRANYGRLRLEEIAALLWDYDVQEDAWGRRVSLRRAQQLTSVSLLDPLTAERYLSDLNAAIGQAEKTLAATGEGTLTATSSGTETGLGSTGSGTDARQPRQPIPSPGPVVAAPSSTAVNAARAWYVAVRQAVDDRKPRLLDISPPLKVFLSGADDVSDQRQAIRNALLRTRSAVCTGLEDLSADVPGDIQSRNAALRENLAQSDLCLVFVAYSWGLGGTRGEWSDAKAHGTPILAYLFPAPSDAAAIGPNAPRLALFRQELATDGAISLPEDLLPTEAAERVVEDIFSPGADGGPNSILARILERRSERNANLPRSPELAPLAGMRLLWVEASRSAGQSKEMERLTDAGATVTYLSAEDLHDEDLATGAFDAYIADLAVWNPIKMRFGLWLLERRNQWVDRIPVALYSVNSNPRVREQAMGLGALTVSRDLDILINALAGAWQERLQTNPPPMAEADPPFPPATPERTRMPDPLSTLTLDRRGEDIPIPSVVFHMHWSPDGEKLAIPTVDGRLFLWDWRTGTVIQTRLSGKGVNEAAWSPGGRRLAIAYFDRRASVWNVTPDGRLGIRLTVLASHRSDVRCVAWSPNGRQLATGTGGGSVRLWDTTSWKRQALLYRSDTQGVNRIAWSPDGVWLAYCGETGAIGIVRAQDPQRAEREDPLYLTWPGDESYASKHPKGVTALAWSPQGNLLASGTKEGRVTVRTLRVISNGPDGDVRRTDLARNGDTRVHQSWISALAFSPDGRVLATRGRDSWLRLWETETWSLLTEIEIENPSSFTLSGLAWNPQFPLLAASASGGHNVRLWNIGSRGTPPAADPPDRNEGHRPDRDPTMRQFLELGITYENIRESMPSGDERTMRMSEVVHQMLTLAKQTSPEVIGALLPQLKASTAPGTRLAAIVLLEARPDVESLMWLAERLAIEQPFVGYRAAQALWNAAVSIESADLDHVSAAIAAARTASSPIGSDRLTILEEAAAQVIVRRTAEANQATTIPPHKD